MGKANATFAPLAREGRFLVVLADWQPPPQSSAMDLIEAITSRKPPRSLAEPLAGFGCRESPEIVADKLLIEADAIQCQVQANKHLRRAWMESGHTLPSEWAIIVEVGRSFSENAVTVNHDGSGVLCRDVRLQLRVHKPATAMVEMYRFDQPARLGAVLEKRKATRRRGDETQRKPAKDAVSSPASGI